MDAQTVTYLIALFGMAALYHWLLRSQRKRNAQLFDLITELDEDKLKLHVELETALRDRANAWELVRQLRATNTKLDGKVNDLTRQLQFKQDQQ